MLHPDNALDGQAYETLMARIADGHYGEDHEFHCNANQSDHVHIRRFGDKGDGMAGRVGIAAHSGPGLVVTYFTASEARMIAAVLLDAADELDGKDLLMFFPREVGE